MSTNTPNYNLIKPSDADNADLRIFVGQNMDTIDTTLLNKVDATKKASATELGLIKIGSGLSIDANGIVTVSSSGGNPLGDMTTVSAFRATSAVSQSMTATVPIRLIFGQKDYDNKNELDATTGRFTAQQAGIYLFTSTMRLNATTSDEIFLAFYKNGVTDTRVQQFTNGGTTSKNSQAHGSVIMKLNAGDYVDVYGYSAITIGTAGWETTGYYSTYFSGIRLI